MNFPIMNELLFILGIIKRIVPVSISREITSWDKAITNTGPNSSNARFEVTYPTFPLISLFEVSNGIIELMYIDKSDNMTNMDIVTKTLVLRISFLNKSLHIINVSFKLIILLSVFF